LAIIKGAASVRAIKPSLAVVTSGVSPLAAGEATGLPAGEGLVAVLLGVVQPWRIAVPTAVAPAVKINLRLESLLMDKKIVIRN
jgi:hypothetical protein